MSKVYLYAAAVQGIQDFIFKTNELRHIVGASELVEQICTSAFDNYAEGEKSVVRAAGNIKHIFETEEACKRAFRNFPGEIMRKAPGVTVSQAVAEYDDSTTDGFSKAIDEVEKKLKIQRNKPPKSVLSGLMGIKRANNTGFPVTKIIAKKGVFLDDATSAKIDASDTVKKLCEKSFGMPIKHEQIAYNISEITDKNDWIAIIHADGNGLGKVVQKVGKDKTVFREFSEELDKATTLAANAAYEAVMKLDKAKDKSDENRKIPIRPVVLSGDDLTVIIRGNLAIEYAKVFIEIFEVETKKSLEAILKEYKIFADGKDYLTACAGIAFVKSSYPFYYGYQLAEELCGQAKKDTKARVGDNDLPDSCLMFHKVQDSFITNYESIVERELSVEEGQGNDVTTIPLFKAGPYYTKPQADRYTVEDLEECCKKIDGESGNGVKSGVRNWITLRLEGKGKAEQRERRMKQIFSDADKNTIDLLIKEDNNRCIANDVLAYHTIINQETK